MQTITYHRIYYRIQRYRIDIQEDANNHKVVSCKYLSGNLCTAIERTSQMGSPLRFFFLDALLPLCVGGSEGGAVLGVGVAR